MSVAYKTKSVEVLADSWIPLDGTTNQYEKEPLASDPYRNMLSLGDLPILVDEKGIKYTVVPTLCGQRENGVYGRKCYVADLVIVTANGNRFVLDPGVFHLLFEVSNPLIRAVSDATMPLDTDPLGPQEEGSKGL